MQRVTWVGALVLLPLAVSAGDITGAAMIDRKLSKRDVTASAGLYQRGAAPALHADHGVDPLDYERSHVVVYIEDGPRASPQAASAAKATLQQEDRRFVPDLLVIPAGAVVSFPNFDPIFHNVFSLSKPKNFDLGNYSQGQTRTVTFDKPGTVYVYCHLHPNMAASIVVTPTRWGAVADAAGHFTLSDIPAGQYTLVAWHKSGGVFRQKVQVTAQGTTDVRFLIPIQDAPEIHASGAHH